MAPRELKKSPRQDISRARNKNVQLQMELFRNGTVWIYKHNHDLYSIYRKILSVQWLISTARLEFRFGFGFQTLWLHSIMQNMFPLTQIQIRIPFPWYLHSTGICVRVRIWIRVRQWKWATSNIYFATANLIVNSIGDVNLKAIKL